VRFQIEKLVYGGDGLARLPSDEHGRGKSVFIPFVLEGEQVEAAVTEEKPGFARARLESVLQASADRITPGCPYFQRCGGCHYQHADYSNQLKIKAAILEETLRRTAKLEIPCELQLHPSPEWNYRNRTRLKVETTPHFALGYYAFRSHDLLPVERCPISSPLINRAIEALWKWASHAEISPHLREIEFFTNQADDRVLLEVYCGPGTPRHDARELAQSLEKMLAEVSGVTVFETAKPGGFAQPKPLAESGAAQLTYKAGLADYKVSTGSFFQVNRFQVDELVKIVTENVSGKVALDLYAGVGLFSVVLARSFQHVIAVEASQTSSSDLRANAPREIKAVLATTEQFLRQTSGLRPDLVVADPPRGGLGDGVVHALARLGPPRITYVSCDPSTLARDLRTFVSLGFRIVGAHLVDLFPQTFHIESVFQLAGAA
jgi:23S rRNA (uracil1939-C5)-methyltransferase